MKVFMIGGTGLLGCEAARIFIERGHDVTSVALPPLPQGAPIPEAMHLEFPCNRSKNALGFFIGNLVKVCFILSNE